MFDLAAGVYRLRPLTDAPLDLEPAWSSAASASATAHDLLVPPGAVRIVSGEPHRDRSGLELNGQVTVDEDRPRVPPADGARRRGAGRAGPSARVRFFRTQGLKQGPCPHLIALRLCHADQEAKRLAGVGGREAVQVETRTYSRRDGPRDGDVVQLSLERQRVKIRRGEAGQAMRLQTLRFNTPAEAREAYFAQVDRLDAKGYLDATAGA
jgi:hypothetical protein